MIFGAGTEDGPRDKEVCSLALIKIEKFINISSIVRNVMIKIEIMLLELLVDDVSNVYVGQIFGSVVHEGPDFQIIPTNVMFVALN